MDIAEIKSKLFSERARPILDSEFSYLYRDTANFILGKYQEILALTNNRAAAEYILPWIVLDAELPPDMDLIEKRTPATTENRLPSITLVRYAPREEEQILRLIIFRETNLNWVEAQEKVQLLPIEEREKILEKYLAGKSWPELNFLSYAFEGRLDSLRLAEIKAANAGLLLESGLTVNAGYFTPEIISRSNSQCEYIAAVKMAKEAYQKMRGRLSPAAGLIIPLAFLQKFLFTVNMFDLLAWQESSPLADLFLREIKKVHPFIVNFRPSNQKQI